MMTDIFLNTFTIIRNIRRPVLARGHQAVRTGCRVASYRIASFEISVAKFAGPLAQSVSDNRHQPVNLSIH